MTHGWNFWLPVCVCMCVCHHLLMWSLHATPQWSCPETMDLLAPLIHLLLFLFLLLLHVSHLLLLFAWILISQLVRDSWELFLFCHLKQHPSRWQRRLFGAPWRSDGAHLCVSFFFFFWMCIHVRACFLFILFLCVCVCLKIQSAYLHVIDFFPLWLSYAWNVPCESEDHDMSQTSEIHPPTL